jgi:hypothetical protein
MLQGHALAKTVRQWGLIIATGAIGFAMGIAGFAFLGLDGIFQILNDVPTLAAAVVLSVTLAFAALSIGALIVLAQERRRNWLANIALNNMTQGLSMFDSAARLVLCNERLHRNVSTAA